MAEIYSLLDLNLHLKQVMALNFPEPIWIKAEIAQAQESRRHRYFELVQKETSGAIVAQSAAVLWANQFRQLERKPGIQVDRLLQKGREVKLWVRVSFHERYGLKLQIEDVDPAFTLGQLEQQRLEALNQLQALGILDKNAKLVLPVVLQRLAVISSPTAAGWADFQNQLVANPYGYHYAVSLFPAAMQGEQAVPEMVQQLASIGARKPEFDAVVLIRGGGSRLDLSVFDQIDLCKAIANFPLPVFTGIGHEIDRSLADGVAHSSFKTPTAVAEFLVECSLNLEHQLLQLKGQVQKWVSRQLEWNRQELNQLKLETLQAGQHQIRDSDRMLQFIRERTRRFAQKQFQAQELNLLQWEKELGNLRPSAALEKGFALLLAKGEWLRSATEVQPFDELDVRLKDGLFKVRVLPKDES